MGLGETKNIKISSLDFITENWTFIPNGPAVSKPKLQWDLERHHPTVEPEQAA